MNQLVSQTSKIEAALVQNDLSKLSAEERLSYYKQVCESLGLNHLTQPFSYIVLNNRLTLYAKRDAADQLRKIHGVSIEITGREVIGDVYVVTAKATTKDGRIDESTGAVHIKGLTGDGLANAYLKCETKAKRRVTLSLCGLGFLDETEVETIKDAQPVEQPRQIKNHAPGKEDEVKFAPGAPNEFDELMEDADPLEAIGNTICPLKKYRGQRIRDIDPQGLISYIKWLDDFASKQGREPSGEAKDFIEAAKAWLSSGVGIGHG